MDSKIIFRTLVEYNSSLYQRVWESIQQLSGEQFNREVAYSRGSLRNQMVHIAAAEKRWLLALQGDPNARAFNINSEDFPTWREAHAIWSTVNEDFCNFVENLSESDLDRTPPGLPGPIWHVLAHVINHGTDHRAQVLRILHDLGAPTFDQDLVMHLWKR